MNTPTRVTATIKQEIGTVIWLIPTDAMVPIDMEEVVREIVLRRIPTDPICFSVVVARIPLPFQLMESVVLVRLEPQTGCKVDFKP